MSSPWPTLDNMSTRASQVAVQRAAASVGNPTVYGWQINESKNVYEYGPLAPDRYPAVGALVDDAPVDDHTTDHELPCHKTDAYNVRTFRCVKQPQAGHWNEPEANTTQMTMLAFTKQHVALYSIWRYYGLIDNNNQKKTNVDTAEFDKWRTTATKYVDQFTVVAGSGKKKYTMTPGTDLPALLKQVQEHYQYITETPAAVEKCSRRSVVRRLRNCQSRNCRYHAAWDRSDWDINSTAGGQARDHHPDEPHRNAHLPGFGTCADSGDATNAKGLCVHRR